MKLLTLAIATSFLALAVSPTWIFDYSSRGRDWDTTAYLDPESSPSENRCGEPEQQSPINLMEPIGSYGWAYGEPLPATVDGFEKHYKDSLEPYDIQWVDKNLKMKLSLQDDSYIISKVGVSLFGAPSAKQVPKSFHFHLPSEHTVNGHVYDVEMHVSHRFTADNSASDIKKSDLAILFSVENYDRDISSQEIAVLDHFFDLMHLDGQAVIGGVTALSEILNFKEAMDTLDFENRWVYVGSSTRPPCTKLVYRHILRRVYPIKFKYLYMIRKFYEDHREELGGEAVNSRIIFPINGQEVTVIGATRFGLPHVFLLSVPAILAFFSI